MHRLFVALRPPPAMRRELLAVMGGVPGARWQNDDQLRLTLRFIGEVERPLAEDVAAILGSICQAQRNVAISGVGTFDQRGVVHSLWAGISPDEALKMLQQRVNQALARIGLPPESRASKPHITLARLPRSAGPIEPFLSRSAGLSIPPALIDAFLLYESHLGSEGAVYEAIARYPLVQR